MRLWQEGRTIRDNALRESEKSGKVPTAETMSQMDKIAETIRWLLRDADPNVGRWEPWGNWWNRPLGFQARKKAPVVLKSAEPIDWEAIQKLDAETTAWFEGVQAGLGPSKNEASDHETIADGPLDGNRFRYNNVVHPMGHVPCELLREMWGHDHRDMHDVEEKVWGVAGGSQLKDAMHDLKTFLKRIGYPKYVGKANRTDSLIWKPF